MVSLEINCVFNNQRGLGIRSNVSHIRIFACSMNTLGNVAGCFQFNWKILMKIWEMYRLFGIIGMFVMKFKLLFVTNSVGLVRVDFPYLISLLHHPNYDVRTHYPHYRPSVRGMNRCHSNQKCSQFFNLRSILQLLNMITKWTCIPKGCNDRNVDIAS